MDFMKGIIRDLKILIENIPALYRGFKRLLRAPFNCTRIDDELYLWLNPGNCCSLIKQWLLLMLFPFSFQFWIIRVLKKHVPDRNPLAYKGDKDLPKGRERWVFINGICTDQNWLELNCKRLEAQRGVRVVGIYNRTHGFILDVLECILQRNLKTDTTGSVRDAVIYIKKKLKKAKVEKVMLVAHSQGAIITSLAIDRLYKEVKQGNLTKNELGKLRVYTFGGAASEFGDANGCIKVIQHYVNDDDFFANFGVKTFYYKDKDHYKGDLFVNRDGQGHVFNSFYTLSSDSLYSQYDKYDTSIGGTPFF